MDLVVRGVSDAGQNITFHSLQDLGPFLVLDSDYQAIVLPGHGPAYLRELVADDACPGPLQASYHPGTVLRLVAVERKQDS